MRLRTVFCLLPLAISCSPASSASPSPTATPRPNVTASAPSTPAIYFVDAGGLLNAVVWGSARPLQLGPGPAPAGLGHLVQSPDGSRFFAGDRVVTPDGALVGTVAPNSKIGWRWADDSRHLCAAYDPSLTPNPPSPAPTSLFVTLPGSNPAAVAQAGHQFAQSGAIVLACSFTRGTATVAEICVSSLCETWTISLLTKQVLHHQTLPAGQVDGVVSPDGTLIALHTKDGSIISGTADGATLDRLDGLQVEAFSADDNLVVTGVSGAPSAVRDWRGHRTVATLPSGPVTAVLAEPGGSRLAVALGDPADIVVVGADGGLQVIARAVQPQF